MNNHVHFLIQPGVIPLSKIIHNLSFRYSQEINKRYRKIGHLFQGRFKSILLDEEGYFLKLIRYIHMNPVRANLVNNPKDYYWSSHRAYLGCDDITWLTKDYCLGKFDNHVNKAQDLYESYVLKTVLEEELNEFRKDFRDGQILGDDNFLENIKKRSELKEILSADLSSVDLSSVDLSSVDLSSVIDAACHIFDIKRADLFSSCQTRLISLVRGAIVMCAQQKGITLVEMASVLNRSPSALSSLQSRFLLKYQGCNILQQKIEALQVKLVQLPVFNA